MLDQALGVKAFKELEVELEGQFLPPKHGGNNQKVQPAHHDREQVDYEGRRASLPSETSVSCGVVARDTEKPPLSKIDASSSDSSESVMAKASAVFFTSTCRRTRMNTTGEGKENQFSRSTPPRDPTPLRGGYSRVERFPQPST